MSAGVAYAEVSISGNARMGLQYNSAPAAGIAKTTMEKRFTLTVSGSTETDSGVSVGAEMNLRDNEDNTGALISGARVHLKASGVELAMGNIYGAIESMPGVYSASAGLTGLGWGGMAVNTGVKGSFGWDAYSSSGDGAEGIEAIYSAGSFSGHLSYSSDELGGRATTAKRAAAYGSYTMGDWTVAVGMQDSSVNTQDKTIITVGGKVGDFGVGFAAADNDGERKIALNGSATFGATTISAYVADEESATDNPLGLGVAYDLGGAKVVGGVARTATGTNRADLGVSFSF
jgi:outer membrane protein OmpU